MSVNNLFICILNFVIGINSVYGYKASDTLKVNELNSLSKEYIIKGNYYKADSIAKIGLQLAEGIDFSVGEFNALTNIGVIFWYQDNYPKSLEYYYKALTVAEQINNQLFISRSLANIGLIYSSKGDYDKALLFYNKALDIKQKIGDVKAEAILLSNIAQIYNDRDQLKKSLEFYLSALEKDKKVSGSEGLIALNLEGIGIIYKKQKNIESSFNYLNQALQLAKKLDDRVLISNISIHIGELQMYQGRYKESENSFMTALDISTVIGDLNTKKDAYYGLSQLFEKTQNDEQALFCYENYINLKDTIFNASNTKKEIQLEMNFEFEKKQTIEKIEQERLEAVRKSEAKKQQMIIWSVAGILILVLLFIFYVLKNYKEKNKIALEIMKQKVIIEEKQKEIIDSIQYASKIQRALLTSESYIHKALSKLNKSSLE